MMRKSDWESYTVVTAYTAVGRWGKRWYAIDKATSQQIGGPHKTKADATAYARQRARTTYSPATPRKGTRWSPVYKAESKRRVTRKVGGAKR